MLVCQQADIQGALKGERGEKVCSFTVYLGFYALKKSRRNRL